MDILKFNSLASDRMAHKPHIDYLDDKIDSLEIPDAQVQSDWEETDEDSKAYIKNKPTITEQVQSDWNVTDPDSKAYIKNKPAIPEANILYHAVGEEDDGAITPLGVRKDLYADEDKTRVQIGNGANATGNLSTAIGLEAETAKNYSLAIGNNTTASGVYTTALGNNAIASHIHSVALGANSTTTRANTVAVNFESLNRIIEGVQDPEQPQDAMTKGYADAGYVSLTEPNHILGEKTFDNLSMTGDIPWTTDKLAGFNAAADFYYCIKNGVLYTAVYTGPSSDIAGATTTLLWNIPPEIGERLPPFNLRMVEANAMGSSTGSPHVTFTLLYQKQTNTLMVYNDTAALTSMRLTFFHAIPLL